MSSNEARVNDDDRTDGVVPRLMIFPDRPDCLVVYLPRGVELRLPPLISPLSKKVLADALFAAGVDARVSEGTPGKWGAAYKSLHKADVAEREQRLFQATAVRNAERRGSENVAAKSRAEALDRKQAIDKQVRALKSEISEAKFRAFTNGAYLPVDVYRAKATRLQELKEDSQALQVRLAELRNAEHRENEAMQKQQIKSYAEKFLAVARDLLSERDLQRIHGQIQGEALDNEGEGNR